MHFKPFFIFIALLSYACNNQAGSENRTTRHVTNDTTDANPYQRIRDIPLPKGFERPNVSPQSFAAWLRNMKLKKDKTVYLFNGQQKYNQSVQFAVLDFSVGDKDLQQCADAVMRLRAEYFFEIKAFDQIVFYDNNNVSYRFTAPFTRENFSVYLQKVFGMCGSASLSKHLSAVHSFGDIQAGDVLIRGGFPGHAVIVMDVAVNKAGKKIFLLAQGYMPAQDIHVLKDPMNEELSPWYELNDNEFIQTPEYTFYRNEWKRW